MSRSITRKMWFSLIAVALTPLIGCLDGLCADVDQENWVPALVGASFVGEQQEFTPRLDRLDSVQLWVFTPQQMPGVFRCGNTIVNIRDGVNGPILAASKPTYAPPRFTGTMGFGFAEPVNLTPGHVYVIEPVRLDGSGSFDGFAATRKDYPGGKLWIPNPPSEEFDLIFREGIGLDVVPESSPALLISFGLVAASCCYKRGHRNWTQVFHLKPDRTRSRMVPARSEAMRPPRS